MYKHEDDGRAEPPMKGLLGILVLILAIVGGGWRVRAAADLPEWAYPANRSGAASPSNGAAARRTPEGGKPTVRACGNCHLPNGFGRPDSASLAGLPAAYIAAQMDSYRKGLRRSSEPRMGRAAAMVAIAEAAEPEEVQAAAEYFAAIAPAPWIRVVETDTLPNASVSGGGGVPVDGGGTEPLGLRVVEVPEPRERAELRDRAPGFVAYVPAGSIRRGEALVTAGGSGRTVRCALCHGSDLKGIGLVPGIAGRSPSYLARQLYDMQQGTRRGSRPDLMMGTVARLTEADIVAIVAYAASRVP